jgi:hypothetical protein
MCPVACREDVDNVQEVPASSICAATTPSTFATLTELDRQYADWRDGRANVRASSMRRGLRPPLAQAWVNKRDRVVRDAALEQLSAAIAPVRIVAPQSKAL